MIGNSITQSMGGSRKHVTYMPGLKSANDSFGKLKWVNAGISGDRTEHVLWRIKNGNYDLGKPKLVVLAIGVNNFSSSSAEEIGIGVEKIVDLLVLDFPESKILIFGPLPTGISASSKARKKYNDIHTLLASKERVKGLYYFNLINEFSNEDGSLKKDLISNDGIHLKGDGYNRWCDIIKKKYDLLLVN